MTLDARRAGLWRAMGLGPIYALRGSAPIQQAEERAELETSGAIRPVPSDRAAMIGKLSWDALRAEVAACRACTLCERRKQTVFGVGNTNASWMLIGEAPGSEEDQRGEPFVGQAGRLLNNMLQSLGMSREGQTDKSVYIANALKCRPPGNRNPQPEEIARCEPFLRRQVELVNPAVIVVMGRFAAQSLLGSDASIASLRGTAHPISVARRKIPVIVTYHPAYLLRNLADKAKAWADLCLAHTTHREADKN